MLRVQPNELAEHVCSSCVPAHGPRLGSRPWPVQRPVEEDYYRMHKIPIPDGIVLEAGGIEVMPDGRLAVGTRRGDIYMVSNAFDDDTSKAKFSLWAEGLHEVLGLSLYKDSLYVTQRPEVSRLEDLDKDLYMSRGDGKEIIGMTGTTCFCQCTRI